jgi:diguanylate cyclase (GGDEF)-like protein/PAS domain S-box-containing protein
VPDFRKLFDENTSIFLLIEPLSGQIVDANKAALSFYGYAQSKLMGMSLSQIDSLGQNAFAGKSQDSSCEDRDPINLRHRLVSGEERDVEVYASPFEFHTRNLLFLVIHDVTLRKRAEDAIQVRRESLKEAQVIGELGTYCLDIPTGHWTSSEGLDEIFGIDKAYDHSVNGWLKLVHPEDRAMMAAYFTDDVQGKGKPFEKEYRIVRQPDQSVHWLLGKGTVDFDSQGHPQRMRGFIQDISQRKLAERELRDANERLLLATRAGGVGIWDLDMVNNSLVWDDQVYMLFGVSPEHYHSAQKTWEHGLHPDDWERVEAEAAAAMLGEKDFATEFRVVWPDGSIHHIHSFGLVKRDASGKAVRMTGTNWDITEEKRTAEALKTSEARYRNIFEASMDAISITRLSDAVYLDVNPGSVKIFGFSREEFIGQTAAELGIFTDPRDRKESQESLRRDGEYSNIELLLKRKDGAPIWVHLAERLIEIDGTTCVLSVGRDVTAEKQADDEIRSLAFYDPLTGLLNRRSLMERLEQAANSIAPSERLKAILFIDLDNFKTLNDTLGHDFGDKILQTLARRIEASIRRDDIVARLGGDEFVVMLGDLDEVPEQAASQVRKIGDKILAGISEPVGLASQEWVMTASIGITVFRDRSAKVSEILKHADIAMYQAKAAGRNTMHFFSPELQAAVNARARLEDEIRTGIKANQFIAYYQPQVQDGIIVAAEALARWNHPVRGILPPSEFIPLAEETGLIQSLGDQILESACNQIAAWSRRRETSQIAVAVNISARQFRQPRFVQNVLSIIDRVGANPERLVLEITESLLLDEVQDTIAKIKALRSRGLQMALDDFGTGHSSLSYLKRLPLDQVKIDQLFIRDILDDSTSAAIARSVLYLGRALRLSVVAEGVETSEQRDFLATLGCNTFQGYLFGRPVPIEDFELLLSSFSDLATETSQSKLSCDSANMEFERPPIYRRFERRRITG